jgi:hypothetical protein
MSHMPQGDCRRAGKRHREDEDRSPVKQIGEPGEGFRSDPANRLPYFCKSNPYQLDLRSAKCFDAQVTNLRRAVMTRLDSPDFVGASNRLSPPPVTPYNKVLGWWIPHVNGYRQICPVLLSRSCQQIALNP